MAKKYIFGIKHAIIYDRDTFVPKGVFEVLGGAAFTREIEKLLLEGGHSNSPYGVEPGAPSNEITMTIREYPNFSFECLDNATVTESTSEASTGFVDTIANKVGTSVVNATTGIASIAATASEEDEIPFGRLIFVATGADTVDVYLDGDSTSGPLPIVSDLPKIASNITVLGTGGTVALTDYGITITGGSGAIALTTDDTAYAATRPANTKVDTIQIKDESAVEYVGLVLTLPKTSENEQIIVRYPKVAVSGMSFNATSREFSEFEQSMTPIYDPDEELLYEIQRIKTTS